MEVFSDGREQIEVLVLRRCDGIVAVQGNEGANGYPDVNRCAAAACDWICSLSSHGGRRGCAADACFKKVRRSGGMKIALLTNKKPPSMAAGMRHG